LAALAARKETPISGLGPALLPAAADFKFPHYWVINPSYSPLFILDRLATIEPAGPWADVAAEVPVILERSARGGFAMDWTCYTSGEGLLSLPGQRQENAAPGGQLRRYPCLSLGGHVVRSKSGRARILKALPGMNFYLQHYPAPPEKISADGAAQAQPGPVGFSAALLPYLKALSNEAAVAQQLVRLKSQLDEKSNLYGNSPTYYDQNLALFGSGWLEKRFQFGTSGELLVRWSR